MPAGSSLASSTTNPARHVSAPQMPKAVVKPVAALDGAVTRAQEPSVAREPAVSIR